MSKNNVPYYIAGTLAALTLLVSRVFAAAPYIGFLAPVAALSVGLPFIIGGAVFSAVAIALSYAAISKNKTISEKDAQLASQAKEIEGKDKIISEKEAVVQDQKQTISELEAKIQAQEQTISGQNDQLTKKEAEVKAKEEEISKQKIEINKKNEEINNPKEEIEKLKHKKTFVPQAIKDIKTACEKAFASVNEAYSSGRVPGIVKRGLTDVYYPPIESAKGTISSVGDKLKNVYDTMSSAESARNWIPSLKTAGWIALGAGVTRCLAYIAANRGFTVADNSSNAVGNSTNITESGALIPNLSSTCPRLTMQCQIDEYSKTLADAEEFAKNNFGMSEEDNANNKNEPQSMVSKMLSIPRNLWGSISNFISGSNKDAHNHSEPQWFKDLHKSEDLEEIIDGGTLDNLFSSRVDNGINTSRQQSTLTDSVNLTKLTREVYPNGSPRVI